MRTIHKYQLEIRSLQKVTMPMSNKPLSIGVHGGKLFLWAIVETDNDPLDYEFEVFGTGHPLENTPGTMREFIGTAVMPTGYVWHIFKRLV